MIKSLLLTVGLTASLLAGQRVTETPSGAVNGTNTVFALSALPYPDTVKIYQNGMRLTINVDYSLTSQSLTFPLAPSAGDSLTAEYQALIPSGYHMLISKATGGCVMPSSTNKVLSGSCAGLDTQKLTASSLGAAFALVMKNTGQALDLTNGATTDGTQVITAPSTGSRAQSWWPVSLDNDNFFELTNGASSSSCLTLSSGSLILQSCSGLDSQKWQWQ